MKYTVGELIDRLAIIHLKIWHLEEYINNENITLEEKGNASKQVIKLNTFRNKLIESLNEEIGDTNET